MKNVMIYAYTASNLGDDLFILQLCSRYPDVQFFLYAPHRYKDTFKGLENLQIITNDSLPMKAIHQTLKPFKQDYFVREVYAKKCDIGIYIGGSLFMEHLNWHLDIRNLKSILKSHKHTFIIGANFGPFTSEHFKQTYEKIFTTITDICFRDNASYSLFSHLPNVRLAPDILFQMPAKPTNISQGNIIFSVIHLDDRRDLSKYKFIYVEKIAEIATYLLRAGEKITFISFCNIEKDDIAINKIKALIPNNLHENISTYFYETNINEALAHFEHAKAVVATRFHAMILGWIYQKPVFPIIYSEKMLHVMEDILFPGKYVEISDIGSLKGSIVKESFEAGFFQCDHISQFANEHFKKLDMFLG